MSLGGEGPTFSIAASSRCRSTLHGSPRTAAVKSQPSTRGRAAGVRAALQPLPAQNPSRRCKAHRTSPPAAYAAFSAVSSCTRTRQHKSSNERGGSRPKTRRGATPLCLFYPFPFLPCPVLKVLPYTCSTAPSPTLLPPPPPPPLLRPASFPPPAPAAPPAARWRRSRPPRRCPAAGEPPPPRPRRGPGCGGGGGGGGGKGREPVKDAVERPGQGGCRRRRLVHEAAGEGEVAGADSRTSHDAHVPAASSPLRDVEGVAAAGDAPQQPAAGTTQILGGSRTQRTLLSRPHRTRARPREPGTAHAASVNDARRHLQRAMCGQRPRPCRPSRRGRRSLPPRLTCTWAPARPRRTQHSRSRSAPARPRT
jgi:hypothetical protein